MSDKKVGTKTDAATDEREDKEVLWRVESVRNMAADLMDWRHKDRIEDFELHKKLLARLDRFDGQLERVAQRLRQIEYALANASQEVERQGSACEDCFGQGIEDMGSLGRLACETCNGTGVPPREG